MSGKFRNFLLSLLYLGSNVWLAFYTPVFQISCGAICHRVCVTLRTTSARKRSLQDEEHHTKISTDASAYFSEVGEMGLAGLG